MKRNLLGVFFVALFLASIPAVACDFGYIDAKHAPVIYLISFGIFVCLNFVFWLVQVRRVFTNFIIFMGLNFLVFALGFAYYWWLYVEEEELKDSPVFAFTFVFGFVLLGAGWILHSFLNLGVAAKADYKKMKEEFDKKQKEHHDPEGLR